MTNNQTQINNEEEQEEEQEDIINEEEESFTEILTFEQKINKVRNDVNLNRFRSPRRDSSSTTSFIFDTSSDISTAGAKLFSVKNNGSEKAYIDKDGEVNCIGLEAGTGAVNCTGADVGSEKITNVKDPTVAQDAATKKYVDDSITLKSRLLVATYAGTLYAEDNFSPTLFSYDALTITKIKAYVKTAPVGGSVVVDINKNGVELDTVTISAGNNSGEETGLSYSISATDLFTFDISTATSPAADLTVVLYLE